MRNPDGVTPRQQGHIMYEMREQLAREICDLLDTVTWTNPEMGQSFSLSDVVTDRWQEVYAEEASPEQMNDGSYYGGLADVMQMAAKELVRLWDRG